MLSCIARLRTAKKPKPNHVLRSNYIRISITLSLISTYIINYDTHEYQLLFIIDFSET